MENLKTVLTGTDWKKYLNDNDLENIPYLKLYNQTYKYVQIFKL